MAPCPRPAGSRAARPALVVLALIALTCGAHVALPRYASSDHQLVRNPGFGPDLEGWRRSGDVRPDPGRPGAVRLRTDDAGRIARLDQTLGVPESGVLLVRAAFAADLGELGDNPAAGAWVFLGSWDGPRWLNATMLAAREKDSHGWQVAEMVHHVPAGTRTLEFTATIWNAEGTLRVADVAVVELLEQPGFRIAAGALLATWGLTAFWVGAALYRDLGSVRARRALVATIVIVAVGLLTPEFPAPPAISRLWTGAAAALWHAALFLLLALMVRLGRPRDPFWLQLGGLMLLAAASEVVQLFIPGRAPELGDWLADGAGALAGLVLAGLALRRHGGASPPRSDQPASAAK